MPVMLVSSNCRWTENNPSDDFCNNFRLTEGLKEEGEDAADKED